MVKIVLVPENQFLEIPGRVRVYYRNKTNSRREGVRTKEKNSLRYLGYGKIKLCFERVKLRDHPFSFLVAEQEVLK